MRAPTNETDRIVAAWNTAQGVDQLPNARTVSAHLVGSWGRLAVAFDPVLCDPQFRIVSDERYEIDKPVTEQTYHGPGGAKHVIRDAQTVHVSYNGHDSSDENAKNAAMLVADCYRMCLLGPLFFKEHHGQYRLMGTEKINASECDKLSVDITPGLGSSAADTIELSIDRTRHLLIRIRMSPSGWPSTRGKTGTVLLGDFITVHGITFPTSYYEQMEGLIPIYLHEEKISGLQIDAGTL